MSLKIEFEKPMFFSALDIERKGNKGFRSYQLVGKEVNSYGAIFFLERMDGQTSV